MRKNSYEYTKLFLDNPVPMLIFNEESLKIIAVNKAIIESYGYTEAEFLNMTILDIRPAEDIPMLLKHIKQPRNLVDKGEIWRHRKKDGSLIYVEIASVSIEFDNQPCRLVVVNDITEKKMFEQKFFTTQDKFNALVDKALFGIYIVQDGKFVYINEEFAKIFGYDKDEIINKKSLFDLLYQKSFPFKYGEIFERLSSNSEVKRYQLKGVKKDGTLISIEVSSAITEYEGKIALIGTVLDITEINRNAETLSYYYELEKLLSKISTRFVNLPYEEIDKGIDNALMEIGQFMEVDRSYIFEFSEDGGLMSNTFEWCAKGIEPQIENLQNLPTDAYIWTLDKFSRYDVLKIPNVEHLPPEASNEKEILLAQDIKSLILVPLFYSGKLIGFIGFDSVLRYRDWEDNSATVLKMLGEILTNAIVRRKSESELTKLYNAISQIHESMIVTNISGIIEYVNPAFEKLTGYKKEEVIGHPTKLLKSGLHDTNFYQKLWDTILSGRTFEAEFINKKKNGELYYQESTITPLKDKFGNVTNFICIGRDVTEKKKEEQIRKRLTAIIEATSDFVSTADCDSNILYINRRGKLMVGLDEKADCTKMKISDFHPEWAYKKIVNEGIPKAIECGLWMGETALVTKNGREIPASQVIISHKNNNGEVEYYSTIIRDITDIKKAELELKNREELYRLLIENQTDFIIKYDLDWRLLYASNTFCELFGLNRSEIIGRIYKPKVHLDDIDYTEKEMQKLFNPPYTTYVEHRMETINGWRWLAWSFKAELDEQGRVSAIIGSGRDITDRKLYEEEIKEINKKLEQKIQDLQQSQKEISVLLKEVTQKKDALEKLSKDLINTEERERRRFSRELHDSLGQIISNLKLNLDLVNVSMKSQSYGWEQYLKISQDLVNEAIQEIKQLSYDLRPSVLDDFGFPAALKLLANQFQKRSGILVKLNISNEEERFDPIVETELYRITQECLANILKHAYAQTASIQFIKRNNIVALTIWDDGRGFDPRKISGGGEDEIHFGLKNIRERVEFLGGKLYIESGVDLGTEISVEIELKDRK